MSSGDCIQKLAVGLADPRRLKLTMRYKFRSGFSFSSGLECAGLLMAIALRSSPGMMVVGMSVTVVFNPKRVEALSFLAFPPADERKMDSFLTIEAEAGTQLRFGFI